MPLPWGTQKNPKEKKDDSQNVRSNRTLSPHRRPHDVDQFQIKRHRRFGGVFVPPRTGQLN
jgi:hypothetical protein